MKLASVFLFSVVALALAACEPEPTTRTQSSSPPLDLTEDFFEPQSEVRLLRTEVLYAPVYSSILTASGAPPQELAANLSIRNTDPLHPIFVTAVEYYDNDGKLIEVYLDGVYGLKPMASASFLVNVYDSRGGVGANFRVKWGAETSVTDPVVETVMLGSSGTRAFAFSSPARVISSKQE